ncbi:MAG: TIGR00730 family Rossman fold protein [Rhodospirillaceae bacterium]|nr:TIGR00730 family Rossman fold protein [Rhodospirillaceae bacterium]
MRTLRSVCVFCGSSPGLHPLYGEAADALGIALAKAGLRLVYGGGKVGLMGRIADAALAAGGAVVGVIPRFLMDLEVGHLGLTEMHIVSSMHERKAMMAQLSDAFAVLPGGIGTLEEMFEILTWGQLGLHPKPCGILNVSGYYNRLSGFLDHMVDEGFLKTSHRNALQSANTPEDLLTALKTAPVEHEIKWVGLDHV